MAVRAGGHPREMGTPLHPCAARSAERRPVLLDIHDDPRGPSAC